MASAEADPKSRLRVAAFERGREQIWVWTTGRNLLIDYRWAALQTLPLYANVRKGIEATPARFNSRKYHPRRWQAVAQGLTPFLSYSSFVSDPIGSLVR